MNFKVTIMCRDSMYSKIRIRNQKSPHFLLILFSRCWFCNSNFTCLVMVHVNNLNYNFICKLRWTNKMKKKYINRINSVVSCTRMGRLKTKKRMNYWLNAHLDLNLLLLFCMLMFAIHGVASVSLSMMPNCGVSLRFT